MYYVDMHCHILPGVDDGSKDMEMTMRMLQVARDNGIGEFIVTPHNNGAHRSVSAEGILRRTEELQKASDEAGFDFVFHPGSELYFDSTLPDRLDAGEAITLAGSRYCLVEFSPGDPYDYIQEGLRSLSYAGYRVILAHCERYICLLDKPDRCRDLVRNGVLLQVNAASVKPVLFRKIPRFVDGLLEEELVSFVSTDAHRDVGRAPEMKEAATWLRKHCREDYYDAVLRDNALAVIAGEEL